MELRDKQIQIICAIKKGNDDGSVLDMDQLLEAIPYETTKESIQFSIRALIKKGVVEKAGRESRRGRSRITFKLTDSGKHVMRASKGLEL